MGSKGIRTYLSFISYIGTKFRGSQRQVPRRNLEEIDTSDAKMTVQQALDHSLFHIVPKPLYTSGRKLINFNDNQTVNEPTNQLINESTNESTNQEASNQKKFESANELKIKSTDQTAGESRSEEMKTDRELKKNKIREFSFDDDDLYGYRTYVTSRTDGGVCSTMNCFLFDLKHPFETNYKPDHLTLMMNKYLISNKMDLIVNKTIVFNKPSINYEVVKAKQYCYRIAILKPNLLGKSFITKFTFLNHHLNDADELAESLNMNKWPEPPIEMPEKTKSYNSYALYSYLPINELNRVLVLNSKYLANVNDELVERQVNIEHMKEAAKLFYGTHDYTTFSTYNNRTNSIRKRTPVKTISRFEFKERNVYDDGLFDSRYQNFHWYDVYVKADGFLYNQIRRMLGTILAHGFGLIALTDIQYMLDNPGHFNFDSRCFITPPAGLYLNRVDFNEDIEELIPNEEEIVLKETNCAN